MACKVTPWISGDVKPELVGVYQRQTGQITFSKWDGKKWLSYAPSVRIAAEFTGESGIQDAPWRGLKSKPKGTI